MPRTPIGGRVGERLGAGTGSSLEFQEYRPYVSGDDLRHVDWAAYARSEVLAVRLYREEVAPRIDVVLDASRSMAVSAEKKRAYGELAGLLACACVSTVGDSRVVTAGGQEPQPMHIAEDVERFLACDATASALEHPHLPLRRRSLRVVVSDFLFPHDPEALVSRLARESSWLAIVQLTLPDEADPSVEGGRRLVDVEGHGELDMVIDERAVEEYRARFNRLRLGLSTASRRVGARFAHVVAGPSGAGRRTAARRGRRAGGRMMFATPLGLLALLAIPAIVAIHLFRRRFPVRPVAGLFLWQFPRQTPEGGGKITKLPITASLLLECLAALALALILAGARLSPAGVSPHLVVVLDDSASMAAVNARGESARDRAAARVRAEVERLGARTRVTLVRSGERPSVLAGPAANASEVAPRTRAVASRGAGALAGDGPSAGARTGRPERPPHGGQRPPAARRHFEAGVWVSVGEPLANVGITDGSPDALPGHRRHQRVADDREPWRCARAPPAGDLWRRQGNHVAGSRSSARRLIAHASPGRWAPDRADRAVRRCAGARQRRRARGAPAAGGGHREPVA